MDQVIKRLADRTPGIIGMNEAKGSAVCVPLIPTVEGYQVLFEVRSSRIDVQPGDICFPGGMMEQGETPEQAAVRECMEELQIEQSQIHVLAPMDILHNQTITIYPYLITLENYEGTFSRDEVGEVFTVPLSYFLETDPECHVVSGHLMPSEDFPFDRIVGGRDYQWRPRREKILFYDYQGRTIWGLTAKIMDSVAKIMKIEKR